MDAQGRLYDKFYELVKGQSLDKALFATLPDARRTSSYSEYMEELSEWQSRIHKASGHVTMPQVIGRCYFRPRADLYTVSPASL